MSIFLCCVSLYLEAKYFYINYRSISLILLGFNSRIVLVVFELLIIGAKSKMANADVKCSGARI